MDEIIESQAKDYASSNAYAPLERSRSNGNCRSLAIWEKNDLEKRIECALTEAYEEGARSMKKLIDMGIAQ